MAFNNFKRGDYVKFGDRTCRILKTETVGTSEGPKMRYVLSSTNGVCYRVYRENLNYPAEIFEIIRAIEKKNEEN